MAKSSKKARSAKSKTPKRTVPTRNPEGYLECAEVQQHVENQLDEICSGKFNHLRKCNDCELEPNDRNLPQINTVADVKKLNTACDGYGGFLSAGNTDSFWEVGLGTANSLPGSWIPAFVVGQATGAWTPSPFSNANWISFYNNGGHDNNVDIYYRIRFVLNSNINPASFEMAMDFYADNSVFEIYVNGVAQSASLPDVPQPNPYNYPGFQAGNQARAVLNHDWQACVNEIIVHIKSGGPFHGFLAQNASQCENIELPEIAPDFSVVWGDSECDCMETNDLEVLCITACNNYCNIGFEDLTINQIILTDSDGNPVPDLPDGTPSIEVLPIGPVCFGDIGPCLDNQPNCKTRQIILRTRGALDGKYTIKFDHVCYRVSFTSSSESCFEFDLCKD